MWAISPFGDAQTTTGVDTDVHHFASLDHDSTSLTDHADFRQYSENQGRWLSPDPYSGSYDFGNPQTLNRYAYAANNPLAFQDRSGLDENLCDDIWWCTGGAGYGGGDGGGGGDDGGGYCPPDQGSCGCDPLFYDCDGSGGYIGDPGSGPAPDPKQFVDLDPNHMMTENLGLPAGMRLPTGDLIPGIGSTGCEFGPCGGIPSDNFGPGLATAGASTLVCQFLEPCGAIEDAILITGVIVTGAAAIWKMSQHGPTVTNDIPKNENWDMCYLKLDNERQSGSGFHTCWYQCTPSGRVFKRVQYGRCDPYATSF